MESINTFSKRLIYRGQASKLREQIPSGKQKTDQQRNQRNVCNMMVHCDKQDDDPQCCCMDKFEKEFPQYVIQQNEQQQKHQSHIYKQNIKPKSNKKLITNYFDNGQLKEEYSICNGKRVGKYTKWDQNGNLLHKCQYEQGVKKTEQIHIYKQELDTYSGQSYCNRCQGYNSECKYCVNYQQKYDQMKYVIDVQKYKPLIYKMFNSCCRVQNQYSYEDICKQCIANINKYIVYRNAENNVLEQIVMEYANNNKMQMLFGEGYTDTAKEINVWNNQNILLIHSLYDKEKKIQTFTQMNEKGNPGIQYEMEQQSNINTYIVRKREFHDNLKVKQEIVYSPLTYTQFWYYNYDKKPDYIIQHIDIGEHSTIKESNILYNSKTVSINEWNESGQLIKELIISRNNQRQISSNQCIWENDKNQYNTYFENGDKKSETLIQWIRNEEYKIPNLKLYKIKTEKQYQQGGKCISEQSVCNCSSENNVINKEQEYLINDKQFYDNGTLKSECNYVPVNQYQQIKNGRYVEYYENGQYKIECEYKHNHLNGTYTEWSEPGTCQQPIKYAKQIKYWDGYKQSSHINTFNSQGILTKSFRYVHKYLHLNQNYDDKLDGVYQEFYDNGQIKKECKYENGILQGTYTTHDPTGKIIKKCEYSQGQVISVLIINGINVYNCNEFQQYN